MRHRCAPRRHLRWSAYKTVVEGTLHSFQALTDPAALKVQPQRVAIVKLAARTTIAALARQRASPVSEETLALINQVALDTSLETGQLVKWVVGPAALATRSPQNTAGR